MTKRLKWSITTIALLVLAVFFLWMGMTSMRNTSASAAENDAAATEASTDGWYITGQGAGSLRNCGWDYQSDLKLTGFSAGSDNYFGVWDTPTLTLYEGTRFEFRYSGSASDIDRDAVSVAGYEYLAESGAYSSFGSYPLTNIEVKESGEYQFTLYVSQSQDGIVISIHAYLVSSDVPDIELYDMTVVGAIASNPTMHWGTPAAGFYGGIPMTYSSATKIWSTEAMYLSTTDSFKVFNADSGLYYPGFIDNNLHVTTNGWYEILWVEGSQSPLLVQTTAPVRPAPVMEAGWYIVGNGTGDLSESNWNSFDSALRLNGTQSQKSNYENYYGTWRLNDVLLYQGSQFKLAYNNGEWEYPHWQWFMQANYYTLDTSSRAQFNIVGESNIEIKTSGYYDITITVNYFGYADGAQLTASAVLVDSDVPPIPTYEMYVVGNIASVPTCGWPDYTSDVQRNCISMSYNNELDMWISPRIYLTPNDSFKVYNNATHSYYPSGAQGNLTVRTAGYYVIRWSFTNSQTVSIIPA